MNSHNNCPLFPSKGVRLSSWDGTCGAWISLSTPLFFSTHGAWCSSLYIHIYMCMYKLESCARWETLTTHSSFVPSRNLRVLSSAPFRWYWCFELLVWEHGREWEEMIFHPSRALSAWWRVNVGLFFFVPLLWPQQCSKRFSLGSISRSLLLRLFFCTHFSIPFMIITFSQHVTCRYVRTANRSVRFRGTPLTFLLQSG